MTDSTLNSPEIPSKRESCWPEILKRLPPKQLGICLCVSKKWNKLINSSVFITSQIKFISNSNSQRSNLFLLRSFSLKNPQKPTKEFYYICFDTKKPPETLIGKTIVCPFKTWNGLYFRLVGCVNGVVFLTDDCNSNTYNFILWNPLVNCFIPLPKPKTCFDVLGPYMHVFGFGYDGVNDDFKVVRIVYTDRGDGLDLMPPKAELYSVNEGKWRWIEADYVACCLTDRDWSQCFVNGNVHWVGFERYGEEKGSGHKSSLLLLFSVVKEKFMIMRLPYELRDVCPLSLVVSESRGLLCVVHNELSEMMDGELLKVNLWVKKEYDNGASWLKVASVDVRSSVCSVKKAIYWRNNGELLVSSKSNELVSYAPETGNAVVLEPGYMVMYDACSFVGSLAFLNKDCKKRRSFLANEEDNGSSDDEPISLRVLTLAKMGEHFTRLNQLRKFRRQF